LLKSCTILVKLVSSIIKAKPQKIQLFETALYELELTSDNLSTYMITEMLYLLHNGSLKLLGFQIE